MKKLIFIIFILFMSQTAQAFWLFNDRLCYKDCALDSGGRVHLGNAEGCSYTVYSDIAGNQTICYGHKILKGEAFDTPLLPAECAVILNHDLNYPETVVNKNMKRALLPGEADALIDLFFNTGYRKPVMERANKNQDPGFLLYDKITVNGQKMPSKGLYNRRLWEYKSYNGS